MKIEGSGSINQKHGSADPDPHQNVTDPQHCCEPNPKIFGRVHFQKSTCTQNAAFHTRAKTLPILHTKHRQKCKRKSIFAPSGPLKTSFLVKKPVPVPMNPLVKNRGIKVADVIVENSVRIHKFLGPLDLDPDPLVRGMDPDPSIIKQK